MWCNKKANIESIFSGSSYVTERDKILKHISFNLLATNLDYKFRKFGNSNK